MALWSRDGGWSRIHLGMEPLMLLILYFRMWGVKYTHHRFVEYVRRVIMRLRSKRASDTGKEQDKGSERWIL